MPPSKSIKTESKNSDIFSGVLIVALFAFIVFLNYFTEIPIRMQMLMTTISILVFWLAVLRFNGRKIIFQMSLMGMALSLLLLTVSFAEFMAPGKVGILYIFLFINCGLWILMGNKLKLLHFHSGRPGSTCHSLLFTNITSGFK